MPRSHHCLCCGRDLTVSTSIERGLGPICYGREAALAAEREDEGGDKHDLPFDPATMDIVCRRDEPKEGFGMGIKHFNIFQVFRHHSPSGFEWGYGGSGPADFCLNIIALFTADLDEPRDVQLWDGKKINRTTWNLYQRFKRSELFGSLPHEGGTIKGEDIRRWVDEEIKASKLAFAA